MCWMYLLIWICTHDHITTHINTFSIINILLFRSILFFLLLQYWKNSTQQQFQIPSLKKGLFLHLTLSSVPPLSPTHLTHPYPNIYPSSSKCCHVLLLQQQTNVSPPPPEFASSPHNAAAQFFTIASAWISSNFLLWFWVVWALGFGSNIAWQLRSLPRWMRIQSGFAIIATLQWLARWSTPFRPPLPSRHRPPPQPPPPLHKRLGLNKVGGNNSGHGLQPSPSLEKRRLKMWFKLTAKRRFNTKRGLAVGLKKQSFKDCPGHTEKISSRNKCSPFSFWYQEPVRLFAFSLLTALAPWAPSSTNCNQM